MGRPRVTRTRYKDVANVVRAMIEDGTLRPGEAAPTGVELSRVLGYSMQTCRIGLRLLVTAGVLTRSGKARFRVAVTDQTQVAVTGQTQTEGPLAAAEEALSVGLVGRRRAHAMTQPNLAGLLAVPVTTVGHAETRRLWQARNFWERADAALDAHGELLLLHDAYLRAKRCVSPKALAEPGAALTRREQEVAELFAAGMSYEDIGRKLTIASGTVQFHIRRIHAKAGTGGGNPDSRHLLTKWLSARDRRPVQAAAD